MADPISEDHPLAGVWLKWHRAHFHFKALDNAVQRFYEPDSYTPYAEIDAKQRPTVHVRNVRQPSLRMGILVGDIIHNLRSSLDHLVYELSRPRGGGDPSDDTEFPIFLTGPKFKGKGPRDRASGRYKIRAVRRGTKGIIEGFQPYHRRKDPDLFSLWQLHELSRIDKHRLVHVVTSAAHIAEVKFSSQSWNIRYGGYDTFTGPLEEDSVVARFHVGKLEQTTDAIEADLKVDISLDIAFDKRSPAKSVRGESVRRVLATALDVVHLRVIPELRPFLE